VREALGRLAADGLVELLPNRGARVATVGAADMEAAYLARAAVEPAAARLAAERVAAGGADGTSAVAAGDGAGAEERTARHIRCALGLLADRLAEGAARR